MSNKNVKKNSKKTILYIEAVVYICAIIVGIFACNLGNIYVKMLPILFVLGVIGRIVFDRPVITTIFGIITSLCINKITSSSSFSDNLFISLINGLNIALGELFGEYLLKSKNLFDKKKKTKNNKKVVIYIITGIIFVVSIFAHIYISGNYISYFKAKNSLYSYLNENYKGENFKIVNCKYTFYKTNSYSFEMRNTTRCVNTNFVVLKDNDYAVYDEYKFVVASQNNAKINAEFSKYIKEFDTDLDFKIGYLNSGDVKLIISKNVENVNDKEVKDFVFNVNKVIEKIFEINKKFKITNIELNLVDRNNSENSLISDFDITDIEKSDNIYEYIINSLTVEFIDN
jgi:hypothetical protein